MKATVIRGAALGALILLAACQTAEERAEEYYQSGLSLLESGDTARALVEFRNVFQHDGFHKEARRVYADTLLAEGEQAEAYSQYLRFIEQYPDTVEVRQILAEIAIASGDVREIARHGETAISLAPDSPRSHAIASAIAYRAALRSNDLDAQIAAAADAQTVLESIPDNVVALRVVIDHISKGDVPSDALPLIERMLVVDPDSFEFHTAKLRLLTQIDDGTTALTQLEDMFVRFPDNPDVRTTLVNWHLATENYESAERVLRALAGPVGEDAAGALTVVQFLRQAYGDDAAIAELDALIAKTEGQAPQDLYHAMNAMILFDRDPDGPALDQMAALTKDLPETDQSWRIKAMYAQMLNARGDQETARAVVEEILEADRSNVDALKIRAAWLIEDDLSDFAITDLRTALSQNPRDAGVMLLMATAHERAGFPELAGERLALAVEVSGAAPAPSLRYARFLIRDDRTQAAASVLNDARRTSPENLEIISVLADLYLSESNWPQANSLLATLQLMAENNPQAAQLAAALEAAILSGQDRTEEGLAVLQDQLGDLDEGGRAALTIALAQVRAGKIDEARAFLQDEIASNPDDQSLRLLNGSVAMLDGDADTAEATFRAVLTEEPGTEAAVRLLYSLLHLQERDAEKAEVLAAGLSANPSSEALRWIKAGALENAGDIEGAIAIYEELYVADTSNVVIANNLASLIATHYDDQASIDRAFRIARRLRGMEVPAFQDTYGWIAYRRGDFAEARDYLEPAARALPGDPLVQFHLGMTYDALKETAEAERVLTRALEIAGDSTLPQFEIARDRLDALANGQ